MSRHMMDALDVSTTIETTEGLLENARQKGGEVLLVLGSRIDAPVLARVTDRNGSTFEFDVAGKRLRMDVHAVVLLVP
jgi:hypothetical protein